jgi:hypothetical protein
LDLKIKTMLVEIAARYDKLRYAFHRKSHGAKTPLQPPEELPALPGTYRWIPAGAVGHYTLIIVGFIAIRN